MFFVGCALLAIILQLFHQRALQKGKPRTLVGRVSTFERGPSHRNLLKYVIPSNRPISANMVRFEDDVPAVVESDGNNIVTAPGYCDLGQGVTTSSGVALSDSDDQKVLSDSDGNVDDSQAALSSSEECEGAAVRLQLLVETGAFDEIVDCVQSIKRRSVPSLVQRDDR